MSKTSKQKSSPQPLLRRLWLNSQTKLWAYVQGSGAAVLAVMDGANRTLHSSEFQGVLATLTVPWYITTGIAVFALITYLAHGHGQDV